MPDAPGRANPKPPVSAQVGQRAQQGLISSHRIRVVQIIRMHNKADQTVHRGYSIDLFLLEFLSVCLQEANGWQWSENGSDTRPRPVNQLSIRQKTTASSSLVPRVVAHTRGTIALGRPQYLEHARV